MCSAAHHGGRGVNLPWEQHLQFLQTSGCARPAFSLGLHHSLCAARSSSKMTGRLCWSQHPQWVLETPSWATAQPFPAVQVRAAWVFMVTCSTLVWESQLGLNLNISVNVQSVPVLCAYILSIQDRQIGINLCNMRSEATNPYHIWWCEFITAKDCINTLI